MSLEEELFILAGVGFAFGISWAAFLWALEGWGFVDFTFVRNLLSIPHGWT